MKTKILTSILVGILVISFISVGIAVAANGNGAGLVRVPVLIGFKQVPGPSEQALVRSHGGAIKYSYTLVPAIAASIPEPAIEGLRHNPNVTIIEPDIEVYAVDTELDNSWGVKHIGAGTVHNNGNKGTGIKVAIIDSGIYYTHPDLNANYKGGKDFVNNDNYPMDDNGHGTHCAGIVAAEDNGSGVVGVAPEADLYALKVLNSSGSGDYSDVIAALQWAVNNDIQVTSNSYGSSGDPGITVKAAFDNAASKGIINVCAAGNNYAGEDTVIYPAKYASCIAVAATNSNDTRASFSSTGPDVEISAPGVSIYSTYLRGRYASMSGTSMACPHVSGVVALMINANVADVRTKLQDTADYLGNPLWFGYGLVDADEAAAGSVEPPVLTNILVSPSNVTLYVDDDQPFTASGKDQYGDPIATGTITWESNNESVGTINGTGLFTALGIGDTTITATGNAGVSGTAGVTVQADPVLDTIEVTPSNVILNIGDNQPFTASGKDQYGDPIDTGTITWTSGNAAVGTINEAGSFAALGIGVTTVTATVAGGVFGTASITVQEVPAEQPMYVEPIGMDLIWRTAGKNIFIRAVAVVMIMDAEGPVVGATVYGSWSGATSDIDSGVTDSQGLVELTSDAVKNPAIGTKFTFTVDDVVKSGWDYEKVYPNASITVP